MSQSWCCAGVLKEDISHLPKAAILSLARRLSMVSHHLLVVNQHCDRAPSGTAGAMVLWDWRKTKFSGDVLDGGQLHEGHFCETWSGKFCHRIKRLLQCLLSTSVFCCWRLLATYLGYGHRWAEVSLATGGLHLVVLKAVLIYSW